MRWHALCLLIICAVMHSEPTLAQTGMLVSDTSSPRGTLKSFIDGCNELYHIVISQQHVDRNDEQHIPVAHRILDCIDTEELPSFAAQDRAVEVAICIKEILDRHDLPDWDEIPDVPAIEARGGFEKLSRWRIPGTRLTITRIEEGDQKHEYLFSAGTVERAVDYYHDIEGRPYRTGPPETSPGMYKWYLSAPGHPAVGRIVQRLPERVRFGRSFGLANWKWPALLLVLVVGIAVMALAYRLQFALRRRDGAKLTFGYWAAIVFPVIAMLVPFCLDVIARKYLTVRGNPLYIIGFVTNAVGTLAAVVVVFALCNRITEAVIASPHVNPKGLNAQLIRIASRLLSLGLAVVVLMAGGQHIGIPVGTLLASAGIGGVALALGAQDTLKTLFGTLMLMADKPFRVGERIIFKDYDGVVEDIGIRSTKLRLLTSHQVTVPNDELARTDIENVGRRRSIRRVADFHLPLDTPCDKTELALAIVRDALEDHEGMDPEFPPRVYFLDILPNAFAIRAIYWYHPPNYWDYLAYSERLNFSIFRAFEEHGIRFSLLNRIEASAGEGESRLDELRMVDDLGSQRRVTGTQDTDP